MPQQSAVLLSSVFEQRQNVPATHPYRYRHCGATKRELESESATQRFQQRVDCAMVVCRLLGSATAVVYLCSIGTRSRKAREMNIAKKKGMIIGAAAWVV